MPVKPESHLQRLRRSFHEIGPLYTSQNVVKTVVPERVLRINTAFIFEADLRDWPRNPTVESEVRWATKADSKLFGHADSSEVEFLEHLARGAQIAICDCDGVLLGYFIYETGDIYYYPWLCYRLAPDVIWTSMAWTAPEYRGKGVHGQVQQFALSELSRQGYVRKLASVDATNVPSLRASIKKSMIVGSVSFMRSFGLTAVWINGRMSIGNWHDGRRLELDSDLFRVVPNHPYGPVDVKHFERLISKRI